RTMSTDNPNRIIQVPKQIIHQSHDIYGKDSLNYSEIIVDCLKMRLNKKLLERIDFTTLAFLSTEFIIGDQLVRCQSDTVYRFSIDIDNNKDVIYFIIELQSTPDRYMADRLDVYKTLLELDHKKRCETRIRPATPWSHTQQRDVHLS
ncbi:MAG: Rpn family recombination-promoting nuclease/putative transposase, partial [Bacteroidota bacterium]